MLTKTIDTPKNRGQSGEHSKPTVTTRHWRSTASHCPPSDHARARGGSATGGCASGGSAVGGTPIAYGGGAPVGGRSRPGLGLAKKGLGDRPADRGAERVGVAPQTARWVDGACSSQQPEQQVRWRPGCAALAIRLWRLMSAESRTAPRQLCPSSNMQLQAVVKVCPRSATRAGPSFRSPGIGLGTGTGTGVGPKMGEGKGVTTVSAAAGQKVTEANCGQSI